MEENTSSTFVLPRKIRLLILDRRYRNRTNFNVLLNCFAQFRAAKFSLAFFCVFLGSYVNAELSAQQQVVNAKEITLYNQYKNSQSSALTDEQIQAKTKGIELYNQYKPAEPELRIAAEAGDAEAQFYLAEELRQKNQYITPEAKKWLESASSQGNFYAMLRLARSNNDLCTTMNSCPTGQNTPAEWLNLLKESATLKANNGDPEAAYIMYLATGQLAWLEKSAASGFAEGQWLLATRYKEGKGSFILPWKRTEAVERWAQASAKGGNPKGMMEYAAILFEKGDVSGFRYWNEQAANISFATTVYGYGSDLAHEPDTYGYPYDIVKGYALILLLTELNGGGGLDTSVNDKLPRIAAKMNPAQIAEAKNFAQEWKKNHPPLSFYPEKLGF